MVLLTNTLNANVLATKFAIRHNRKPTSECYDYSTSYRLYNPSINGAALQSTETESGVVASFITARCTLVQSAVLRLHVVCLSVCSSLRPSVTLVNCDHIGWNSSKIISPLVSLGRSLFATPT